MSSADRSLLGTDPGQARAEYSARPASGSSRHRNSAPRPRQSEWIRRFYFALSSLWGFAVGASATAAAGRLEAAFGGSGLAHFVPLAAGLALAVAGGVLSAAAYRTARSRTSR